MTKRTTDAEFLALVEAKQMSKDAPLEWHPADIERLIELAKKGQKRRKSK